MAGKVQGKVAAITGGASGFGEATARLMVAEGASVVLADIQDAKGQAIAKELGGPARYVHCDVSREADISRLVDTAAGEFGRLDCMFNNAGIVGAIGPIDEITLEEYEFTMAVLLRSVFLGMKHAARVMKPQGSGVIVSTSSVAGVQGGLGPHVYAAAKTAIVGLTKNVAAELGPWGIRVNAIAPGKHATAMNADVAFGDPTALDKVTEHFTKMTPLRGRPGLASDIAQAALWLFSDEAGFVSGHTMVVDGGLTTGTRENITPAELGLFATRQPLIREAGGRGV